MQLRDIEYVVKIAETKNFTQAAEQLYISQSALSQSVQRLENEFRIKLFNREPNIVTLTYAGKVFYDESLKILAQLSRISNQMSDLSQLKYGELHISMPRTYIKVYVTKVVREFHALYPDVKLLFMEGNSARTEEYCGKGKAEIGLVCLPVSSPSLRTIPLFDEPIYLAVPAGHPICQKYPEMIDGEYPMLDISQFKDEQFILLKGGQRLRDQAIDICKQAGFKPQIIYETVDLETAQEIVSSGMGMSFVSETIRMYHGLDTVRYFRIADKEGKPYLRTLAAIYSEDLYLSKGVREFVRILKDVCDQTVDGNSHILLYP